MSASGVSLQVQPSRIQSGKARMRVVNTLAPLLMIAAVGIAWDLSVRLFHIPAYLLPPPGAVLARIVREYPLFIRNSLATLWVIIAGFGISVVLGICLALLVELNRTAERILMPLIVGSQTIPKVAIAPLFVVWLGFGYTPKIVVTFLISFFPVVISTVAGLRAIEPDMLDLVRSMGAGPLKVLIKARIPTALPQVFSGIKIAITSAVVGAIVAEFVGSDVGLGYLLLTSTASMDGPLIWSALLILVAMGVLLYVATVQVERLSIPWHVSMRSRR
jgi:NitT/TauT family transport system permease protein